MVICQVRYGSSLVAFAGAVQDFTVLFISRPAVMANHWVKWQKTTGFRLRVLRWCSVHSACDGHPCRTGTGGGEGAMLAQGLFTIAATIPIALLMEDASICAIYAQVKSWKCLSSALYLMMAAIVFGGDIAKDPAMAELFTLTGSSGDLGIDDLWCGSIGIVCNVAAACAAWLFINFFKNRGDCRFGSGDYLYYARIKMPAVTKFIDGTGPVFKGGLFRSCLLPFCGAISGFTRWYRVGRPQNLWTMK